MAQVDLSGLSYLLPLFGFFIVFIVSYISLGASKLLDDKWGRIFLSFLISSVFVTVVGARDYVLNITVWFSILIVSVFFLLMLTGFIGKMDFMNKWIGGGFVILLLIAFLVSFVFVFSNYFSPYIPGPDYGYGGNPDVLYFTDWLFSPRVFGAILLIGIGSLVSWILVRGK
jgi:glucan phosphoethanolaminetransferase (alkaline phosphatase superfamily)